MKITFKNAAQLERFEEYLRQFARVCGHLDHHGETSDAKELAQFLQMLRDMIDTDNLE